MRGDYSCSQLWREPSLLGESLELRGARAGDDDNAVKFSRNPCLIEQGNIHQQPCVVTPGLDCLRRPAGADSGVKDCFESLALSGIRKDNLAQFTAIRPTCCIESCRAKCQFNGSSNQLISFEQFMHAAIRVEIGHRLFQQQRLGKSAFTRRNATSQAENRHRLLAFAVAADVRKPRRRDVGQWQFVHFLLFLFVVRNRLPFSIHDADRYEDHEVTLDVLIHIRAE